MRSRHQSPSSDGGARSPQQKVHFIKVKCTRECSTHLKQPISLTFISMMVLEQFVLVLVLGMIGKVTAGNVTVIEAGDTCEAGGPGPWSALLEEWATAPAVHSDRHGRIMALPPANGYYVTERIDGPLVPPPPPLPPTPGTGPKPHAQYHPPGPPQHGVPVPLHYNEWESSPPSGGKIVNRPPNPYKDKFKPSYAPPSPSSPATRPQRPSVGAGAADRVDAPPGKQVSETDLYLLGAIEKLVYRVDLMEKRLRRMEESVHYLVAGADAKPEPCAVNFTRVGGGCYQWSRDAADWKGASIACRAQRAALVELLEHGRRRALLAKLLADDTLTGDDFWTGGLNPGLLWIWSHSARPVETGPGNGTGNSTVAGAGRCLALAHDPAARGYVYRGRECGVPLRYICQKDEDGARLSNDIKKAARSLRLPARSSKLMRDDDV